MSKFSLDACWEPNEDTPEPERHEKMRVPVIVATDGVVNLTPLDVEQVATITGSTGGNAGVMGVGLIILASEVAKLQKEVRILSNRVFELEVERTARRRVGAQQLPHGHGDDVPPPDTLSAQVDRLANFIMAEVPGEPSRSEGAVDAAIRLLRERQDELKRREDVIRYLWRLLDDVDTLDDVAKSDEIYYRDQVRKTIAGRWATGVTTDGYTLDLSKMHAPRGPREAAVSRAGWNTPGEVDFAKAWRPTDSDRAAQRSVLPVRCGAGQIGCDLEGAHGHAPQAPIGLPAGAHGYAPQAPIVMPPSRCMHGVVGCPALSAHVHPCGAIGPWSAVAGGRGCERTLGHDGMHWLTTTTEGQQLGQASW